MAQRHRFDAPGVTHHVMNRGASKRVIFPARDDHRAFLSRLACGVRRHELRVQLFVLMRTHFHLLVSTEAGTLSYGMMRLENSYVRRFNRRFRRDGSLPRGRFRSRPVDSFAYWHTLVRYIDHNPVRAGLCLDPADYDWGSARHYAGSLAGPPWLDRQRVETFVASTLPGLVYRPEAYREVFDTPPSKAELELVRRRVELGHWSLADDLDTLLSAPRDDLKRWMEEKAKRADGGPLAAPVAASSAVARAVATAQIAYGALPVRVSRNTVDGWALILVGLMRELASLELERIAALLGAARSTVYSRLLAHRKAVVKDALYGERAAEAAEHALRSTFPRWGATSDGRVAIARLSRGEFPRR